MFLFYFRSWFEAPPRIEFSALNAFKNIENGHHPRLRLNFLVEVAAIILNGIFSAPWWCSI